MPQPAIVDNTPYRGDTWAQELDFIENGLPLDLTGATVTSQARNRAGDVFDLDVAILDATAGKITIGQNPVDLPAANYVYDVQFAKGAETTTRVRGRLYVQRDVSAELP